MAQATSSTGVCVVSQPREEFSSRRTASRLLPARAMRPATGTIRSTDSCVGLTSDRPGRPAPP